MFKIKTKGQSILEYTIMFAVVVAALVIMQAFIKRGYQGSLKSSADKMGEQFSAGNTTIQEKSTMAGDQTIHTEVGTTSTVSAVLPSGLTSKDLVGKDVYSYSERSGAKVTSETTTKTESAKEEKTRLSELQSTKVDDFADPTVAAAP